MDLMFEDEVDEVGSDVEAYCPKCKADTTHVVISKYEDEIRRVQCNPCGDVHSFRKPRGEAEDDMPEPVAARKRALLKKPSWEEFFAKKKPDKATPYEFRDAYKEHAMVNHPKFGVGFVSEVVSNSKVEISFQDARRILVHNRKDIPPLPIGDGKPTGKSSKAPASKAKAEVPGPAAPSSKPAAGAGKGAEKVSVKKSAPAAPVKAAQPAKAVKAPPKAAAKAAKPAKPTAKAKPAAPGKKPPGKKK